MESGETGSDGGLSAGVSASVEIAFNEVIRAAISVGVSQVYADLNPERVSWLHTDEQWLKRATRRFWRALKEEG